MNIAISHNRIKKSMANYAKKYSSFPSISLKDRTWPDSYITKPPIWCSVDLRDGNQSLCDPMNKDRKERMLDLLIEMGFLEIEVGFPSASQTDFDFTRYCIENDRIPNNVNIQVLVQCRKELIKRTFEAIEGAKNPILHFYNSTSKLQRKIVFKKDVSGIKKIATDAAKMITDMASSKEEYRFQYSPESFTGTELEVALEISNAVIEIINPSPKNKIIINLPATVEMTTPNIYADQIEWMCRNIDRRESVIISLHPHNDRGSSIAAAELGLLAGADRIEGTLFGNGERTGNVDIITLALNMLTQGIDPQIDCSNIEKIRSVYEYSNQLRIPERHPYVGELVYTAFSGSHQDAINKGMNMMKKSNSGLWEVPYLPIDPKDVGRSYEAIIRINSQSGKGGISYILEQDYGLNLPRNLQIEFRTIIQKVTDIEQKELNSKRIYDLFFENYISQKNNVLNIVDYEIYSDCKDKKKQIIVSRIIYQGQKDTIKGKGNGVCDGFINSLSKYLEIELSIMDYFEHALNQGSDAKAICYMEVSSKRLRKFGASINTNITFASLSAIINAVNKIILEKYKL